MFVSIERISFATVRILRGLTFRALTFLEKDQTLSTTNHRICDSV
jgi:hypothetical protein